MSLALVLKVSVILCGALAATASLRAQSAAWRHWVLAAAILSAGATPLLARIAPAWTLALPGESRQAPVDASVAIEAFDGVTAATGRVAQERADSREETGVLPPFVSARALVSAIWLAGLVLSLTVLLTGFVRLAGIARRSTPASDRRWNAWRDTLSRDFGLRRHVALLQSQHPTLLVTWGFARPRIILPVDADRWTDDRIRVVLAHELAHVKRNDWLVQMAAELLRSVYWFNPLLWIACRRLRHESEQACDDAVLRLGIEGPDYATHLLDLARALRTPAWFPAPAMVRASNLERRISAMLNTHLRRSPMTLLARAATLVLLAAVSIPVAGFAQARFATFSGSVADETGALVPGATLALTHAQTKAKNEVRSNDAGYFEFVGLPAGNYRLEARRPGFENLQEDVAIGVGQTLQRNLSLRVGTVEEMITVTGGPPAAPRAGSADGRRQGPRPQFKPCPAGIGGCIHPPVKIKDVRPLYPASLNDSGIEGGVQLEATIGLQGKITEVRLVRSAHADLERPAMDAVRDWEFTPTLLNGQPIEVRMKVSVSFKAEP